jgi:hypothetical protein
VLAEGMVSYLQDTNTLEVYDGAAWIGATGDITALTAGTGISISSATGPVPTVTNSMATEIAAKGDLIAGTGSATFDNLTVGANNLVLTADSSTTTGLKWAAPDPLTTKGDLFTYSTTEARLAVGNNGETLVADSSTSTGLRYTTLFGANKNKILNGDFGIWQRGTSITLPTGTETYTADRFLAQSNHSAGTATATQQTFTPGTAPVAGYEGTFFERLTAGSAGSPSAYLDFSQRIEDVRTFAGQTITLSFWAKASVSTLINPLIRQNFGSGGSANVNSSPSSQTATTSWVRYSFTLAVPSISGKTIGTSSYLQVYLFNGYYTNNQTIDIWGVQVEAGSVATAFQTATGTIQGELAACQRYYEKSYAQGTAPATASSTANSELFMALVALSGTNLRQMSRFRVTKRTAPTVTLYSSNSGTTGKWYNEGLTTDVAASAYNIGDIGFQSYQTAGTTNATNVLLWHYTADAEL